LRDDGVRERGQDLLGNARPWPAEQASGENKTPRLPEDVIAALLRRSLKYITVFSDNGDGVKHKLPGRLAKQHMLGRFGLRVDTDGGIRVPLECRPPEASQGWKAEQPTSTADTRIASSYFRKGSRLCENTKARSATRMKF